MKQHQGQAEVIGLLVLVLLLLTTGIIFLRFSLSQPTTLPSAARQSIEGGHILAGLQRVSLHGESLEAMIRACAADKQDCTLLDSRLEEFFHAILLPSQRYTFTLTADDVIFFRQGDCQEGIVSSSHFLDEQISYRLQLQLC